MKSEDPECDFYIKIYDMIMLTSRNLSRKARYMSLYVCYVKLTSFFSRCVNLCGTCITPVLLKAFSLYATIFHPNINRIFYSTAPQQKKNSRKGKRIKIVK